MDEDTTHQVRWPSVLVRVAGCAAVAGALYVLSIGPVIWLLGVRSHVLDRLLLPIYAPVEQLSFQMNLHNQLQAYRLWWCFLPGGTFDRLETRLLNDQLQPPRTEGR